MYFCYLLDIIITAIFSINLEKFLSVYYEDSMYI